MGEDLSALLSMAPPGEERVGRGTVRNRFDFEEFLEVQDKAMANRAGAICQFFAQGRCHKGRNCRQRHARNVKAVVCKHWLRGLCKKQENCEFLHEYDLTKMPECQFFSSYGECSNAECMYLHINPEDKQTECPWYARGFCKHGPKCRHKHMRKIACPDYLDGFCPQGPACNFGHPKFEVPDQDDDYGGKKQYELQICSICSNTGHIEANCPNIKAIGYVAAEAAAEGDKQEGAPAPADGEAVQT